MPEFDVRMQGLEVLRGGLEDMPADFKRAVSGALFREVNDIFNESQRQVPVEFNTLRSSGTINPPVWTGYRAEASIGYGGAASEYAIYVHEILENRHAPPTKAKYLEGPALAAMAGMADRLAARVRAAMG